MTSTLQVLSPCNKLQPAQVASPRPEGETACTSVATAYQRLQERAAPPQRLGLVVDWVSQGDTALQVLWSDLPESLRQQWRWLNAHRAEGRALSWLRQGWDYLGTLARLMHRRRQFDHLVFWQPRLALLAACLPRSWLPTWSVSSLMWAPDSARVPAWALRRLAQRAHRLIFFAPDLAQRWRAHQPQWADKVRVTPMPVVPAPAAPSDRAVPVPSGPYVFCGGRSERDFQILLQASAPLPWPVVLVGPVPASWLQGPRRAPLRAFDAISEAQFAALLQGAGGVVVTLRQADSPCGQLLVGAALAAGVPVVATRALGTAPMLRHERGGCLVPAGDRLALRAALQQTMGRGGETAPRGASKRDAAPAVPPPGLADFLGFCSRQVAA